MKRIRYGEFLDFCKGHGFDTDLLDEFRDWTVEYERTDDGNGPVYIVELNPPGPEE